MVARVRPELQAALRTLDLDDIQKPVVGLE